MLLGRRPSLFGKKMLYASWFHSRESNVRGAELLVGTPGRLIDVSSRALRDLQTDICVSSFCFCLVFLTYPIGVEAIARRLEDIAIRLKAIPIRFLSSWIYFFSSTLFSFFLKTLDSRPFFGPSFNLSCHISWLLGLMFVASCRFMTM